MSRDEQRTAGRCKWRSRFQVALEVETRPSGCPPPWRRCWQSGRSPRFSVSPQRDLLLIESPAASRTEPGQRPGRAWTCPGFLIGRIVHRGSGRSIRQICPLRDATSRQCEALSRVRARPGVRAEAQRSDISQYRLGWAVRHRTRSARLAPKLPQATYGPMARRKIRAALPLTEQLRVAALGRKFALAGRWCRGLDRLGSAHGSASESASRHPPRSLAPPVK